MIAFVLLGIIGWLYGDPQMWLNPVSSEGVICKGSSPYLQMFDVTKCASVTPASLSSLTNLQCPTTSVCVNTCDSDLSVNVPGTLDAKIAANEIKCKRGITLAPDSDISEQTRQLAEGDCQAYTLPMQAILNRCLPALSDEQLSAVGSAVSSVLLDAAGNALEVPAVGGGTGVSVTPELLQQAVDIFNSDVLGTQDFFSKAVQDLVDSWEWILAGLAIAIVLSLLLMTVIRCIIGPIIYVLMVAIIAGLGVGIWFTYTKWQELKDVDPATVASSSVLETANTWKVAFIVCIVLCVIFLLIFIVVAGRLAIAVAVIGEASKAIWSMLFSLLFPIAIGIWVLALIAYWAAVTLFIATSKDPQYENDSGNSCTEVESLNSTNGCAFIGYGGDKWYQTYQVWLHVANLALALWAINFTMALGEMTLAGGFASWYWAWKKPQDVPIFPITNALWRSLRYHIGTLAFGSLIITIIQLMRICLEYIDRKLKDAQNPVAKAIICCLRCCLWCLEKCMKAINKNAYIVTAIYGYHFCKSAFEALNLLIRNALRTAVISGVTFFVLFLGKVVVTLSMGGLSWAFFYGPITSELDKLQNTIDTTVAENSNINSTLLASIGNIEKPELNYYWMPMLVIIVGSYIIASLFFNVYSMAIDTIYICFLEDMERNDGSPEKPYFATKSLMKVMNKKNKEEKSK